MEEKNELNNIVIDDEQEAKIKKTKRLLLVVIASILLFLIIILIIFAVNKEEVEEFSPEAQLQQNLTPIEVAEKEILSDSGSQRTKFEQVPIQDETPPPVQSEDKFDQIVKEIKAKQEIASQAPPPPPVTPVNTTKEESKEMLTSTAPVATPAKEVFQKIDAAPPVAIAETTTVQAPKTSQATSKSHKDIVDKVPSGFYVQVGSFVRFSPNDKLLGSLTENNMNYHILKASSGNNEILRVLVGPYSSRDEASKPLNEIKDKINKDAFIKKM